LWFVIEVKARHDTFFNHENDVLQKMSNTKPKKKKEVKLPVVIKAVGFNSFSCECDEVADGLGFTFPCLTKMETRLS
jgi:hypothetical protein